MTRIRTITILAHSVNDYGKPRKYRSVNSHGEGPVSTFLTGRISFQYREKNMSVQKQKQKAAIFGTELTATAEDIK